MNPLESERLEHEREFAARFVLPEKRVRFASLLQNSKRRHEILDCLNHHPDLDPRFPLPIPVRDQTATQIAALLRRHGAPDTCWVISSDPAIDSRSFQLDDALNMIVALGAGSVISCLPGKLAYYEGEDAGVRYLLKSHE